MNVDFASGIAHQGTVQRGVGVCVCASYENCFFPVKVCAYSKLENNGCGWNRDHVSPTTVYPKTFQKPTI